ncbi:DUF4177 domain-containing protein [Patescibacteria group bacterium]
MKKWEYKILKLNISRYIESDLEEHKLEGVLEELGKEGWELVNIFDLNNVDGKSNIVVANLKRPLEKEHDHDEDDDHEY